MNCKPLVCFGNAYDCEPAIKAFKELPCDKLQLDYITYPNNFIEAQKFFLKNKQYTHFVYLAPDLVIDVLQFRELVKMVEAFDFPVYGPVCNVDMGKYIDKLACCNKLPSIDYQNRNYRWVQEEARQYFLNAGMKYHTVKFNALAFCFIKREILEKYEFGTLPFESEELPIWENRGGWACDLAFAHYCDLNKIPIKVDLTVKLKHLRYPGKLLVGVKKPLITFIPFSKHGEQNSPKGKISSSSQIL